MTSTDMNFRSQGTSLDGNFGRVDEQRSGIELSKEVTSAALSTKTSQSVPKDGSKGLRARLRQKPELCFKILLLCLGATELALLYGPPATAFFVYEDDEQCLPSSDQDNDEDDEYMTLVDHAIRDHCDCARDWMRGGVYFDPVATSYAAVLVAIAFMLRRLVLPLRLLWSAITKTTFGLASTPLARALKLYHVLPPSTQRIVLSALQELDPDMPAIGPRPKEGGGGGDGHLDKGSWLVDVDEASNACKKLLDNRPDTLLDPHWDTWKAEWNEASTRLHDLVNPEPVRKFAGASSPSEDDDKPEANNPIVVDERKGPQEIKYDKETKTEAAATTEDKPSDISTAGEGGKRKKKKSIHLKNNTVGDRPVEEHQATATSPAEKEETEENPCTTSEPVVNDKGMESMGQVEDQASTKVEVDQLQRLATPEWVAWIQRKSTIEKQALIEALEKGVVGAGKEAHGAAEKDDAFVFFALQLTIGLVVLVDYFLVQEQPSGKSWMCRPAYIAGVMMYKPFTIPLWSCLTLCCHYTFAEKLYGSYRRDPESGTPYNSPLSRNKATFFMIGTVALLQCAWAIGIAPLMVPLILAFLPVVPLPAFVLPLASIFAVQRALNFLIPKLEMCFEEKALEAVERDAHKMKALAPWHRGSESFLRSAVSLNGVALEFVSGEMKLKLHEDKDVVAKFVQRNGMALEFASEGLKGDAEIAMLATSQSGLALQHASEEMKADRDVVLNAVQQNGLALKHASWELRDDTEVVLLATSQNRFSLQHATYRLREENKILKSLKDFRGSPWEFLEKTKEDPDLAEAAGHAQRRLKQAQSSWQQEHILEPPPIEESVFLLKAAATILVSVGVVPLVLLPFYEHGFSWWAQGARLFVDTSFDLPRLTIQFSFALRFPHFEQPRLAVQLAFGVILVVLQLSVRVGKWCIWAFAPELRLINTKPGVIEVFTSTSLSGVSWKPFRLPLELLQGLLDAVRVQWPAAVDEVRTYLEKRGHGEKLVRCLPPAIVGAGACAGVFPLYVATNSPSRQKTFTTRQGDVEVEDFCASEDSTSFNKLLCRDNHLVGSSALKTACMRCGPWLVALDFSNSPNLSGDIKCFVFLAQIESLKVGSCGLITGDIEVLVNCPHLRDLAFTDCQQISGSFKVFTTLSALQKLSIRNTSIDCSSALELISSATWAPHIKELDLSATNAQGDISALGKCTNLITAHFKNCTNITGDIKALGNCTNLEIAIFQDCYEITGSFEVFTSLLALQELDVSYTKVDCSRALELISSAPWAPHIKKLGLGGSSLNLGGSSLNVQGDVAALGKCTNLKTADFFGCTKITGDKKAIQRALPNCSFSF